MVLISHGVVDMNLAQHLRSGGQKFYTPLSDDLHNLLRERFRELIPDDAEYTEVFDRFECLLSLTQADWSLTNKGRAQFSKGSFGWRGKHSDRPTLSMLTQELASQQGDWPPLAAGMFAGSLTRANAALSAVAEWSGNL